MLHLFCTDGGFNVAIFELDIHCLVSCMSLAHQDRRSQAEYVNLTGGEGDEQPSRVGSDVLWCWLQLPATSISPNLAPCDDISPPHPTLPYLPPYLSPICFPLLSYFLELKRKREAVIVGVAPPTTTFTTTLVSHNSSFYTFFSRSIRPSLSLSVFIYWEEDAIWGGDGAKVANCNIPLFLSALLNHFIHFPPLYSHSLCLSHVDFVRGGRDKRISWFTDLIMWYSSKPPTTCVQQNLLEFICFCFCFSPSWSLSQKKCVTLYN